MFLKSCIENHMEGQVCEKRHRPQGGIQGDFMGKRQTEKISSAAFGFQNYVHGSVYTSQTINNNPTGRHPGNQPASQSVSHPSS
jgi:hypothetical protein